MRPWLVPVLLAFVALAGCTDDGGGDGLEEERDGGTTTTTTSPGGPSGEGRRDPVTWVVPIRGSSFVDSPPTIQRGDTVRWVHEDGSTTHRVESREGSPETFDSGDLMSVSTTEFEWTFETVGDHEYFCRYHPGVMSEALEVREAFQGRPGDPAGPGGDPEPTQNDTSNMTGEPREPVTWSVDIQGSAFVDGTLTVQKGDTVTWTQHDEAPHTVTADNGEFGSGPAYLLAFPVVDTYSYTFDALGEFPYHCEVHPSMQATITVVEVYQPTPGG